MWIINRFSKITQQISKACIGGKRVVVCMDDNIDTLGDNSFTNCYKNIYLKKMFDESIIENSLTIHNNKPTFHRRGVNSCVNHIMSNTPLCIDNIRIYKTVFF